MCKTSIYANLNYNKWKYSKYISFKLVQAKQNTRNFCIVYSRLEVWSSCVRLNYDHFASMALLCQVHCSALQFQSQLQLSCALHFQLKDTCSIHKHAQADFIKPNTMVFIRWEKSNPVTRWIAVTIISCIPNNYI